VGIDGDNSCRSAIAQAGVDFCITGSRVSFDSWYGWLEAPSTDFSGFSVSTGNVIKVTIAVTIAVTTTTTGSAVIENQSTGQSVTHTWTRQPYLPATSKC
jgi:hypothetical protein